MGQKSSVGDPNMKTFGDPKTVCSWDGSNRVKRCQRFFFSGFLLKKGVESTLTKAIHWKDRLMTQHDSGACLQTSGRSGSSVAGLLCHSTLDHLWILDEIERLAGVSYGVSVSRVSWLSSGWWVMMSHDESDWDEFEDMTGNDRKFSSGGCGFGHSWPFGHCSCAQGNSSCWHRHHEPGALPKYPRMWNTTTQHDRTHVPTIATPS